MNVKDEALAAEKRIRKYMRTTPLEYSGYLSSFCKANVHLKLENYQLTGSFKIRGALNKVLSLTKKQREAGVIAASTGNHALGVAHALEITGGKCTIYVPTNTSRSKLRALQYYPVKVRFYGKECEDTEVHARKLAKKKNKVYISPYNDWKIMWVQITWRPQSSGEVPILSLLDPPPHPDHLPEIVLEEDLGAGWTETTYTWWIEDNPPDESFRISGTIDVDELVIDTWCIPEPATVALLGLGGLLLRRRRK